MKTQSTSLQEAWCVCDMHRVAILVATMLVIVGGGFVSVARGATWTNTTSAGNEWNTAGNWLDGVVPGTNDIVFLTNGSTAYTVNYDTPMVATNIFALTISNATGNPTILNVNTNGFKTGTLTTNASDAVAQTYALLVKQGGIVNINTGGVVIASAKSTFTAVIAGGGQINLNGGVWSNLQVTAGSGTLTLGVNPDFSTYGPAGSALTINSGTLYGYGIYTYKESALNIYGGSVILPNLLLVGLGASPGSNSVVTMTNGSLSAVNGILVGYGRANSTFNLSGGAVTNGGPLIVGDATSGANQSILNQSGGLWFQKGAATFGAQANNVGSFNLSGGVFLATNLVLGGAATSTGFVTVTGGSLLVTNSTGSASLDVRRGTFTMRGGTLMVDQLLVTNGVNSVFSASGGSLTIKSAAIGSSFSLTNSAATISSNLTVISSGSLSGTNGLFVLSGNFINQSTNRSQFDLSQSTVLFTNGVAGATNHLFDLTGGGAVDMGSNGFMSAVQLATNFSIGTLSIASSNNLIVTGTKTGSLTNALYVGWLDIQGVVTNSGFTALTNSLYATLSLTNINLYYDMGAVGNAYLGSQTYDLWGGQGLLIPIPEPSTAGLILGGALLSALLLRQKGQ